MKHLLSYAGVFCLYFCSNTQAQSPGSINGAITATGNKPVPSATVSLLRYSDSGMVHQTFSKEDGTFTCPYVHIDTFLLSVTAIGFRKYFSRPLIMQSTMPVFSIRLEPADTSLLQSVTVTGKKPMIERLADRTVVNVDAFIGNAGATALDVLEKSPGVQVDNNGTISLRGKSGVMILIDDKPTYLSGAELAGYLRSLPADQLDKIEIMTNPPANYDAAGNAGVIVIRIKKNKRQGLNGNISLTYGQGVYWRTTNNASLNYRYKKINLFTNFGFSRENGFNDLFIYRTYKNNDGSIRSFFNQNSFIRRKNNPFNSRLGVDYYLSPKTTFGLVLNGMHTSSSSNIHNISNLLNAKQSPDSIITALNDQQDRFRNGSINLNYRYQFDTLGQVLTIDADHVRYELNADQLFRNASFHANYQPKTSDTLRGHLPSDISIYSIKADYTYPLANKGKLEGGIKSATIKTDNVAVYDLFASGVPVPDLDKSNHFIYREQIHAAYLNINKEYRKFGIQLGLRAEHTISKGHQLGNSAKPDSAFTRSYTNFFPTFYLSFKPGADGNHRWVLSYGKRIARPYFKDLNPFVAPLDKFTVYVGNPYLKPVFSHNTSLAYTYKSIVTGTVYYNYQKDAIVETIELQGTTFISRPNNFGRGIEAGINLDATLEPFSWWRLNLFGEYQLRSYKTILYTQQVDTSAFYGAAVLNNQWTLPKDWSLELYTLYVGKRLARQFVLGEFWTMNVGIQKKVLNKKGSVKLNLLDVFYTRVNKGVINNLQNGESNYHNMGDSRQLRITFSYAFGKTRAQRSRSTGAETEQGRVQ